jgi:hypothetical protein
MSAGAKVAGGATPGSFGLTMGWLLDRTLGSDPVHQGSPCPRVRPTLNYIIPWLNKTAMTDNKGAAAVREMHTGEKSLQKMQLGDDAPAVAKRLTMGIYRRMLRSGCQGPNRRADLPSPLTELDYCPRPPVALGWRWRITAAWSRAEGEGKIVVTWPTGGRHKRMPSFEEWRKRTPTPK